MWWNIISLYVRLTLYIIKPLNITFFIKSDDHFLLLEMLFCYDFLYIFPASPVSFLLTLSQLKVLPQTIFLKITGQILVVYFPFSKPLVFLSVNSYILMTLITYYMFIIYKQNLSPDLSTELLYTQLPTWVVY